MRFFRFAAYAAALLASTLLVAEQAQKASACACTARTLIAGPSKRPRYVSRTPLVEQTPANGVVIYNGNQKQTKAFSASRDPGAPVHNLPPAVIAIVTSGSKSASARPIVVGISSSTADARPVVVDIASSGSSRTAGRGWCCLRRVPIRRRRRARRDFRFPASRKTPDLSPCCTRRTVARYPERMNGPRTHQHFVSQYLAALTMLQRAIRVACPENLWLDAQYTNPFWHIAYHAVFYTHFYLHVGLSRSSVPGRYIRRARTLLARVLGRATRSRRYLPPTRAA